MGAQCRLLHGIGEAFFPLVGANTKRGGIPVTPVAVRRVELNTTMDSSVPQSFHDRQCPGRNILRCSLYKDTNNSFPRPPSLLAHSAAAREIPSWWYL